MTAITLLGGLAGTAFFPLSLFGLEHLGWRGTLVAFAVAEFFICLPLHVWCIPAGTTRRSASTSNEKLERAPPVYPSGKARGVFAALSTSFALSAFITSAISVHVINLLR